MEEIRTPEELRCTTRGEFLALRETAVRELERRIGDPSELVVNAVLVSGATYALVFAGTALDERPVETFHVVLAVVAVVAALLTVPPTVRRALSTRKQMAAVLAWETAERQTRSLPPGQVRPDLRMSFDARQDADFEDVVDVAVTTAEFRPTASWLTLRAVPAALGLPLGLVLVAAGFSDLPAAWGVAGGYLSLSCLVRITSVIRTMWRLREVWTVHTAESRAWRSERIGPVAAAELERALRRQRWRTVAPFIAISSLGLVATGMRSAGVAVAAVVVIAVVAWLVLGGVWLARWLRRPAPAQEQREGTAVPPG